MIRQASLPISPRLAYNIYDNIIVALLFLFLPFNYALTINLGFPLKISEIALLLSVASIGITLVLSLRLQVWGLDSIAVRLIILFIFFATISTIIHLKWGYPYPRKVFESRSSYKLDSLLKLFYLYLNVAAMLVAANAFRTNPKRFTRLLFWGATIAALYTWYLAIASFYDYSPFLLPGMDETPQKLNLSAKFSVIRCGTFKEGNYMGVFLLITGVIAFYFNKQKQGLFFLFSILPTLSTIAILSTFLFLICYLFKRYFRMRYILHLLFILAFMISVFGLSLLSPSVRFILVDKVVAGKKSNASFSKMDRLNSVKVSKDITLDNPLLGIGLSNYALHYDHYNTLATSPYTNKKPIPNNVFMEMLCETGIIGASIFFMFIIALYRMTSKDTSRVLRYGLIALLICFNAFPTFSVLFIWVFIGLIISLKDEKPNYSS